MEWIRDGPGAGGWKRRARVTLTGADTKSRRKEVFLLFLVNRDAIPPWPQHSDTAQREGKGWGSP